MWVQRPTQTSDCWKAPEAHCSPFGNLFIFFRCHLLIVWHLVFKTEITLVFSQKVTLLMLFTGTRSRLMYALIIALSSFSDFLISSINFHTFRWEQLLRWVILKALVHYNWNCKKSSYRPYTLQLFFTTATIFSTVLYMDNNFYNDFFRKIFVKIFVVCEGL